MKLKLFLVACLPIVAGVVVAFSATALGASDQTALLLGVFVAGQYESNMRLSALTRVVLGRSVLVPVDVTAPLHENPIPTSRRRN